MLEICKTSRRNPSKACIHFKLFAYDRHSKS